MSRQCNNNLSRAISIADYILEDDGHSISEAAKEFGFYKTTIERDINFLGSSAFYGTSPNSKELQIKYLNVKKTLQKVAKRNRSKKSKEN